MKIEMQDLPKVRDALDKLILDQHNMSAIENVVSTFLFRVVAEGGSHAGEISAEELRAVFQARIDENLKYLRQRYQIDFNPAPAFKPTVVDGVDVTTLETGRLGGAKNYNVSGLDDDIGSLVE